jgi:hypothetical protein
MPINTEYDGYKLALEKTTRVRDFGEGEFAVKAKGDIYLPVLGGQTTDEYEAYLMRGYIVPAVEPTAIAISGAIMRKNPTFNPDGALGYLMEDFDGYGHGVNKFCEDIIRELLYSGCAGYLVEYDEKAIAKKYSKESIINVSDDYIVLMQEYQQKDPKDKYKQTTKTEYLELTYDENGNYIQNIWRQSNTKEYVIVDTITPTNRGQALDKIPFVFAGKLSDDPILLHLANVNHKQYMQSTDESHGLHWTALPTLFLFGDLTDREGNDKHIKVGAGSANHINDTEAKAELLEFTGAGLGALKNAIDDKKKTMASIGAKMLDAGGSGVKSAETSRIEASSETATMSVIANVVDSTMAQLLELIAEWMGAAVPEFEVNRDFIDTNLDPQSLLAYLQVYQSGGMSLNSFLSLLVKGELLPKGVTAEDEADRVETGGIDFDEEVTQL